MARFYNIAIIVLVGLMVLSCEEKINWNLQSSDPVLIVDAIFTNEFKAQEVKIYSSYQQLNDSTFFISGATVKASVGNIEYNFTAALDKPGVYYSEPFAIAYDQVYELEINYDDIYTRAFARGAYISELRTDTIVQNDSGLYHYVYTGSNLPAMTEIYYNWSHDTDYCQFYGNCYAAETYYTLNVIDIGEEFAPEKERIYFPSGTTITRRKYSLSAEHQDFIRSLLIETEWRGGLFDVEYGNVPTNFNNGVRGWFGICMVLEDMRIVN